MLLNVWWWLLIYASVMLPIVSVYHTTTLAHFHTTTAFFVWWTCTFLAKIASFHLLPRALMPKPPACHAFPIMPLTIDLALLALLEDVPAHTIQFGSHAALQHPIKLKVVNIIQQVFFTELQRNATQRDTAKTISKHTQHTNTTNNAPGY